MGFSLIEGNLIAVKDTVTEIEHPHESRSLVRKDYASEANPAKAGGSFRIGGPGEREIPGLTTTPLSRGATLGNQERCVGIAERMWPSSSDCKS